MDIVHRNARLVVVVLEDVILNADDEATMRAWDSLQVEDDEEWDTLHNHGPELATGKAVLEDPVGALVHARLLRTRAQRQPEPAERSPSSRPNTSSTCSWWIRPCEAPTRQTMSPQAEHATSSGGGASPQRWRFYAELLACVYDCGLKWLLESWRLKDPEQLKKSTEWGLRRCLAPKIITTNKDGTHMAEADQLFSILDLIDSLVLMWMPEEPGQSWRPAWVELPHFPHGRLLLLVPDDCNFSLCIPAVLDRSEYSFLKRLWFLEARDGCREVSDAWVVLGKSCSFGEVDFTHLVEEGNLLRQGRRIWD